MNFFTLPPCSALHVSHINLVPGILAVESNFLVLALVLVSGPTLPHISKTGIFFKSKSRKS